MQLIKPRTLSLISKTYRFSGKDRLAVGGVCLFRLARPDAELNQLLPEAEYLATCHEALGKIPFDLGVNKSYSEFLAAGSACAPAGQTCTQMQVAITIADLTKKLDVYGNQQLRQGFFLDTRGALEPFATLPLTYATTYGGGDYPSNPVGVGHGDSGWAATRLLPNVTYAGQLRHAGRPQPASFTAQGVDWPSKLKLAGTYDARWQREDAPGYPRDIDWRYFNLAAEDQRFGKPLTGGACYRIEGMNADMPVIEGRLPNVKVRIFVSEDPASDQGFRELETTIDTVWFFPDRNLGMLIQRGVTDVQDSEAQDIKALLLAFEYNDATPRQVAAYKSVMQLRCDRATALANAFNESQLLPLKSDSELATLEAQRAEYRAQIEAARVLERDAMLADIGARVGLKNPLTAPTAAALEKDLAQQPSPALRKLAALPDPSLMITPQELKNGDFDLGGVLDVVDEINKHAQELAKEAQQAADASVKQARALQVELLKDIAGMTTPATAAVELDKLKRKALERTRTQITGIADLTRIDKVLHVMTPTTPAGLVDAKTGMVDGAQLELLNTQADAIGARALRLSRLKSPEFGGEQPGSAEEKTAVAAILRKTFVELQRNGAALNGRDFAGADLSGLDLSGLDLSEAMLEHADLSRCRLLGTNLFGAVLTGAHVDGADFSSADLRNGNLSGLRGSAARFDGCRFDTTVMIDLQLPDSAWRGATFRDNTLLQCVLPRAAFAGAQLERVALIKCDLADSDFSDARWRKVNGTQSGFARAAFARSSLDGVALLDANCAQADFTDALLQRCIALGSSTFTGADFSSVTAVETGWRNLDLSGACFHMASFSKADFANAVLRGCDLRDACFQGSLLSGADCRDTDATATDFYRATLRKADFTGSTLERANLLGADVFETLFHSCKLKGMRTDCPLREEQYV
jgi:uncharacterized protein YjbI with pentapeptide repeats